MRRRSARTRDLVLVDRDPRRQRRRPAALRTTRICSLDRTDAGAAPMMSKSRLEAFSDGVLAVAITLLVLDLKVPSPAAGHTLGHELGRMWPNYVAYVISFVTIGIIWINHHAMIAR